MDIVKVISLLFLISALHCMIHPFPVSLNLQEGALQLQDVCSIFHEASSHSLIQSQYYFNKITKRLNDNLECHRHLTYNHQIHTLLTTEEIPTLADQAYRLTVRSEGIHIGYKTYSGYIYALETLSQLLKKATKEKKLNFVKIEDFPMFEHRGIMIDSAKHFLQVNTIKRLIENMPLSKLNILHWHMMDDESFPILLGLHPELAQAGSFSSTKVYTVDDIKSLIALADKNGVKIVPEIESPSHMRSWVLSSVWKSKNLTISCTSLTETGKYAEQIDPTKSESVQLVKEVLAELDNMFPTSPYLHLGGDKISYFCWDARKQIAAYMKLHNIKTYDALLSTWRFNLKQVLPSSRKIVYWADQEHNTTYSPNDIFQFKGNSSDIKSFMDQTTNKFILSPVNIADLNTGFGNIWLNSSNFNYNTWRTIYEEYGKLFTSLDTSRVLGAELLLWGTFTNDQTFDNNVWMRAAVFGERMWSSTTLSTAEIVLNIVQIQRTLEEAGVDVSPLTSQYCQYQPQICWPEGTAFKVKAVHFQAA